MLQGKQQGSALIVGLILLLCLTILGVAGMNMAKTELVMAGNSQRFNLAQVSATSQLDFLMDQQNLDLGTTVENAAITAVLNNESGSWDTEYIGTGFIPSGGFSLQGAIFSAQFYEFRTEITSLGTSLDSGVTQGAYLISPGH